MNLIFTPASSVADTYLCPVADKEQAMKLCPGLLLQSWDGTSSAELLLNDYGSIVLNPAPKAGVFAELIYNIKGIPTFKLEVASFQYCADENLVFQNIGIYKYYECNNCKTWYCWDIPFCTHCECTSFTIRKERMPMY